jgi:hypothetical protein
MFAWLKELKEDFKASRRGEHRVAPRGQTGRVYARPAPESAASAGSHDADGRASATLHMKITRADGTVELRSAPATIAGTS